MAASVIEECDRLLDMINTMLMISRVESGVESKQASPMDLGGIIRNACDLYQPLAEDRGIRLACETPSSLPFAGDIPQIQRMAANLIDNALKYTPPGGAVTVALDIEGQNGARLTVKDTGVGIPEEDLPRIFERFFRSDRSRSQEGTGLGLSLARAVARAHGGDIAAFSTPGEGSTFVAYLVSREKRG